MTIHPLLTQFFAAYPQRQFDKGGIVMRPGDHAKAYFITQGTVIQYDIAETGDKLIVNTYKEGAFIPLLTVMHELPVDFFFEASSKLSVRVAPSKDVAQFLETTPEVAFDTLRRLVRGTDGMLHRLASMMEGGAELRILQALRTMQARFGDADGSITITMSELGAQTGLARETVSRALKKLREASIISSSRGKIRIVGTPEAL